MTARDLPGRRQQPCKGRFARELAPVIEAMWREGMLCHEIGKVLDISCVAAYRVMCERVPLEERSAQAAGRREEARPSGERLLQGVRKAASVLAKDERRRARRPPPHPGADRRLACGALTTDTTPGCDATVRADPRGGGGDAPRGPEPCGPARGARPLQGCPASRRAARVDDQRLRVQLLSVRSLARWRLHPRSRAFSTCSRPAPRSSLLTSRNRAGVLRAARPSADGGPCEDALAEAVRGFVLAQRRRKLLPGADVQLPAGVVQMHLDRTHGHEQRLGDLTV